MTSSSLAFTCANCGGHTGTAKYVFAAVGKSIVECRNCRLMALDPMPNEEDLKSVYTQEYFGNQGLLDGDVSKVYGYVDYVSERINKQRAYVQICRRLQRYANTGQGRRSLLDLGCGLGFFLDTAFEAGFDVHGVEFNRFAIEYMRQRYAFSAESFDTFLTGERRFDVITMLDVIEHLRDPFGCLDLIHSRLNSGGVVAVSTMDSTSVVSRLMGKRLEDFRRVSEHLYFFSRANLASIMSKHGFDVLDTESKGHSFEVRHLASRIRATLPGAGAPLEWAVRLLPFVGRMNLYFNPRTKFILYARKRG